MPMPVKLTRHNFCLVSCGDSSLLQPLVRLFAKHEDDINTSKINSKHFDEVILIIKKTLLYLSAVYRQRAKNLCHKSKQRVVALSPYDEYGNHQVIIYDQY